MIVRCPQCQEENELQDDSEFEHLSCSSCGSSLSLGENADSVFSTLTLDTDSRPFGHFLLVGVLGHGAFGTVWKANDEKLARTVAIKVPRQQTLGREEVSRFLREARAAAQLKHPNVVQVHEVGEVDGVPYIVSDYIEGVNLKNWLVASSPSPKAIAEMAEKIARAVHHAHQHGIIHRDIKPSNIMVDLEGEPHVMDFGLAKRDLADATITIDGAIIGTPSYMPPEQARGKAHSAQPSSDVYSLGVALFEMLTGELPFRGGRPAVLYKILTEDPPNPRSLNVKVPIDLETVCLKCLEKEPSRRYQTCLELAEELERYRTGFAVVARPVGTLGRILRWYTRNPRASILTAGGYMFCFVTIMVIWAIWGLAFIATGVHPMDRPMRAALELVGFSVALYLPGFIGSVLVLNGRYRALWLNLLVLGCSSAMVLGIMLGITPKLEVLAAASDNAYSRYQLSTLLGSIVLVGLVLHSIALRSMIQLRTSQEAK